LSWCALAARSGIATPVAATAACRHALHAASLGATEIIVDHLDL
jgi:hypothetical protein